jgi:gliding motility-associated-like protein
MKKVYLLLAALFFYYLSNAQISKGKDFWFGFMENYYQQTGEMRVYITSETACSGWISSPLQGWVQTFTVTPGVSTLVVVPYNIGENFNSDVASNQALHVVTTECVSVFAHYYQAYTSDAAVIFPTNSIGKDYVVTSWSNPSWNNGYPEFLIAATENATTIDITPTAATVGGHAAGVTYSISLDSGQVYQLQCSSGDLTGTRVVGTNNKNFGLFGGHVCANVGNCGYCDHLFEQLYPVQSWGNEFITVPYMTRDYDIFRVLASQNGTQFQINGGATTTLNAGQYSEFSLNAVSRITSNLPVSVMQYSTGTDCDANLDAFGDPFMITLSPTTQSINKVTFNAFANSSPTFTYYLNLIAKTNDLSTVTLDGVGIGGTFSVVPQNPAFSYLQRTITQGDHSVISNQGILAYVYGYGEYESYGYSAGVRVSIPHLGVYDTTKAYCPTDSVYLSLLSQDTTNFIYQDSARIVSTEWDLGDGSPHVFDSLHFWHTYPNYGEYPVTLIYELKGACEKDTVVIDTVKILGPEPRLGGPYVFCTPHTVDLRATFKFPPDTLFYTIGNQTLAITDTNFVLHINATQDTVVYLREKSAICDGFDTARIYVGSDTAGFTFSNACDGVPVNFINTSRYVPGVTYSWFWDYGDGSTSIAMSAPHQYTAGGTYVVKLRMISPAGCSDSITKTVTIYAQPHVAFVVNQVCNDSVLTPINNSSISGGTMTYDWYFGDNTAHVSTQNPSHTYAHSGGYNITLVASSGPGCSDSVTLPDNINIGADIKFSGVNVCLGQMTSFTDQTINTSGSAILSYNWNFGDGSASNAQNPTHTYAGAGSYAVTLLLDYGSNCYDSITHNVTVNPIPVPDFTVSDLCNSGTATPVNNSTIASGSMSYAWNFGDGTANASGQNPSHTYAMSGNYTIHLIATSDSLCADSITKPINVIRGTSINFNAPAVCNGSTMNFTDQTTNPYNTTINGYTWSFGDGATSNQQNTTHTYAGAGTYSVQLKLDYGNNCADSLTKQVTVNENPVASFTVNDVCNDSVVNVVNTSTISTGALTSDWSFGDGTVPVNGQSPSHTYHQSGTYTVQLITVSAAGCADTTSNTVKVTIGTHIDFTAPAVCIGNATVFTDNTANPYNTTINGYTWTFGDGTTATQQNTTHTYAGVGTYTVQLKLDYGNNCADSLTKQTTVNPDPVADFTSTTACVGNATQFTDASTPQGSITAWSWSFGDGSNSALQNATHTYAAAGNFNAQLTVTNNNGCKDSIQKQVTVLGKGNAQFTAPGVCYPNATNFTNTTDVYSHPVSSFVWSFGDGTGSSTLTNPSYTYSNAGTYSVTIIANFTNGCADTSVQNVEVYVIPTVSDVTSDVSCFGGTDGSISLSPNAGQTPFTYSWSNQSVSANNTQLIAGNYSVTFTDAHTCTASSSYIISQPTQLLIDSAITQITCAGYHDGAIQITATGATPLYFYNWSNGSNSNPLSGIYAGSYQVTVSDSKGCSVTASFVLNDPLPYTILLDSAVTIDLGQTVQLTPTVINGNAVTWSWSPNNFLDCSDCQNPTAGPYNDYFYTVVSTDDKGCIATGHIRVNVTPNYIVFVPNAFTPNGDGNNDFLEVYGNKETWKQFNVSVFDRWGEKVFESTDMNFKWDGTYKGVPLNPSVLVYLVKVVYLNNYTDKLYKGTVTLMR